MLSTIELYLFQQLLNAATSPQVKSWVISELKQGATHVSNPLFKSMIASAETFLAVPPA
jgi:hypothetical protein